MPTATKDKDQKSGLSFRQIKVYDELIAKSSPKAVQQVAKSLGVDRSQIYRDLAKIKNSDWIQGQIDKMQAVESVAFASFLAKLWQGNPDLIKAYYKGTGVWRDKVDVSGRIETMSDEEIRDTAKRAILEVIQEAKTMKIPVKVAGNPKKVKEIENKSLKDKDLGS